MDIQYKGIPQTWISSTHLFLKHGYPVQMYSSNMDIQYKGIQKQGYAEQSYLESWISSAQVFLKHGNSGHKYSFNMDIQYKGIL